VTDDYRAQADEALAGFAKLGSREDADRTHAWARALADKWEAEKRRLEVQLAGAVEERDALAKLVALYREYGSPDLTRMVNYEAMRTPPAGGR